MNRKWSDRSLSSLKGIHPDLRKVIDRALQISPIDFIVIEGLRTKERQAQLVKSGASKTMNSRHITGHAVDLLPIGYDGKPAFDWPLYRKLAPAVKQAAQELGVKIVWGGDWSKFRDGPHFELDRKVYPAGVPFSPVAERVNETPKTEHIPPNVLTPQEVKTGRGGFWAWLIMLLKGGK